MLNAFPFFPLERVTGVRFPGVLQHIGVCYIFAALLTLRTTVRQQLVIIVALLLGYWAAMFLIPVPPGPWASRDRPRAHRLTGLFGVGSLLMVTGLMWHWVFPINKNIWTSSYVLFTAGMAAAALATCTWSIDMLGLRRWTTPFAVFGVNPLLAFIGSGMMARLIYSVIQVPFRGETVSIQRAIYESAYASWLAPRNASLLFAVTFVLLWIALLWILYRRRVYLRV